MAENAPLSSDLAAARVMSTARGTVTQSTMHTPWPMRARNLREAACGRERVGGGGGGESVVTWRIQPHAHMCVTGAYLLGVGARRHLWLHAERDAAAAQHLVEEEGVRRREGERGRER